MHSKDKAFRDCVQSRGLTEKGHEELSDGNGCFLDRDVGYTDVCICLCN